MSHRILKLSINAGVCWGGVGKGSGEGEVVVGGGDRSSIMPTCTPAELISAPLQLHFLVVDGAQSRN